MKIVKSSVSILPQQSGVDGLMKHVEKIGRLAYKSEDKITEDSWERFDNMLFSRGHWAVFNSGTVYLSIPEEDRYYLEIFFKTAPYTRWYHNSVTGTYEVTTDLRIIYQHNLEGVMKNIGVNLLKTIITESQLDGSVVEVYLMNLFGIERFVPSSGDTTRII